MLHGECWLTPDRHIGVQVGSLSVLDRKGFLLRPMSLNYCELLSVGQWKETEKRPWKGQMFMMQITKRARLSSLKEATRQEKAHRLSIVEGGCSDKWRSRVRGHLLFWLPLFKLPDFYEGTLVCTTVEKRSWLWVVSQIIKCLTKTLNAIWSAHCRNKTWRVSHICQHSPLSILFVFLRTIWRQINITIFGYILVHPSISVTCEIIKCSNTFQGSSSDKCERL